jgi:hypothetical protein
MATSIMRHKGELEGGLGAVIEGEAPLDKPAP